MTMCESTYPFCCPFFKCIPMNTSSSDCFIYVMSWRTKRGKNLSRFCKADEVKPGESEGEAAFQVLQIG